MGLRLSVLDYVSIDEGSTAEQAMDESRQLAILADELGYERLWYSEHHGSDSAASVSPELMMVRSASSTRSISVGSGAILLPNYSSYKVAENYRTMAAMFPGRIDLGIGRSTGGSREISNALNPSGGGDYATKLDDLLGYLGAPGLRGQTKPDSLLARPMSSTIPQPWILGSSGNTAQLAAAEGVGFSFAHFINPSGTGAQAAKSYRAAFKPSIFMAEPQVIVTVFVAVAETRAEAEELAKAFHIWLIDIEGPNIHVGLPSIETARARLFTPAETARVEANSGRIVVGTPEEVHGQLARIAGHYGTDQIMVNPYIPTASARENALQLLSHVNRRPVR